jgi:hypothetical protein
MRREFDAKPMAGYSAAPLAKKLGIRADGRILVIDAPENYAALVAPLPTGAAIVPKLNPDTDLIHLFVMKKAQLAAKLESLRKSIREDAAIWVSWPKKASKVATDISEDVIREVALPLGLVDIKVCAVDETWSGLKLVIRKEFRKP